MDMPNEVDVAFEILLEEIETCVNALEAQNAEAWDRRNLLEAKQLLNRACTLIEFRRKVDELEATLGDTGDTVESFTTTGYRTESKAGQSNREISRPTAPRSKDERRRILRAHPFGIG